MIILIDYYFFDLEQIRKNMIRWGLFWGSSLFLCPEKAALSLVWQLEPADFRCQDHQGCSDYLYQTYCSLIFFDEFFEWVVLPGSRSTLLKTFYVIMLLFLCWEESFVLLLCWKRLPLVYYDWSFLCDGWVRWICHWGQPEWEVLPITPAFYIETFWFSLSPWFRSVQWRAE